MSSGLHHIAILCSDKANARHFYCDALGFEVVREVARPERGDEIVWLSGYGLVLELFIAADRPSRISNPEAYGLRHLALHVHNVDEIAAHVRACGFEPERIRRDTFDGCAMTFVKDPDGLPIELHE